MRRGASVQGFSGEEAVIVEAAGVGKERCRR